MPLHISQAFISTLKLVDNSFQETCSHPVDIKHNTVAQVDTRKTGYKVLTSHHLSS